MSEILIVDDESSIRRSLAGILSDEGFTTRESVDGESALEEVRRNEPDGVLLDIAMPGRDGLEILGELREGWPLLPIMMMSGHGTIETAVRATQLGAFDFVEKPLSKVSFEELNIPQEYVRDLSSQVEKKSFPRS